MVEDHEPLEQPPSNKNLTISWGSQKKSPSSLNNDISFSFDAVPLLIDLTSTDFSPDPHPSTTLCDPIIDSPIPNNIGLQKPLMCGELINGDNGDNDVEMTDVEQPRTVDPGDVENTSSTTTPKKSNIVRIGKFRSYILSKDLRDDMITLENNQPALSWKKPNSDIKITCPLLWGQLGDGYGASLSYYKNMEYYPLQANSTGLPTELPTELPCQVKTVAIFIARPAASEEFINLCRSSNRHTYTLRFPVGKGRKQREEEIVEIVKEIVDCAIECWFVGWHVAVFVDASSIPFEEASYLVKSIRKECDNMTLDVIVIHSSYIFAKRFVEAGSSVVLVRDIGDMEEKFLKQLNQRVNTETINFYNKNEDYYEFTNFLPAEFKTVEFDIEWKWKTSEHYFQAHKFADEATFRRIHQAYSPREAFTIARASPNMRHEWEMKCLTGLLFKEEVMLSGVHRKFMENPVLKYKLLSTGDAKLVEHTVNDGYWGDKGDGTGQNRLGYILKLVRDSLFLTELKRICTTEQFEKRMLERSKWYINDLRTCWKS